MENKQRVVTFSVLATISAAITAMEAAKPTVQHIFIVLPLVFMGVFLFFAGYYSGFNQKEK